MSEYRTLVTLDGEKYSVEVDKVGGGTLGRSYDGDWTASVWLRGARVIDKETLRTGTRKTHREAAAIAADFASAVLDH